MIDGPSLRFGTGVAWVSSLRMDVPGARLIHHPTVKGDHGSYIQNSKICI